MIWPDADTTGRCTKPKKFVPRSRGFNYYRALNAILDRDPAVQMYLEGIKSRRRNKGYVSIATYNAVHQAMRRFLEYMEVQLSDHAFSDLVAEKRKDPSNLRLENRLTVFSNMNPLICNRSRTTYIKGLFARNGIKVSCKIDNHFSKRTPKISDGILKEILEAQDSEKQTLMELQAHSGIGS